MTQSRTPSPSDGALPRQDGQLRDELKSSLTPERLDGLEAHVRHEGSLGFDTAEIGVEETIELIEALRSSAREVERLREALKPFAEFCRVHREHRKSATVPQTGEIYTIENRAGPASITVEALEAAFQALNGGLSRG